MSNEGSSTFTPQERHQVVEFFNATRAEYPQEKLIHELFEEQVDRAPDAVAVVCEGRSLTYAQLNAKANQLAWYLQDRGVGPDQLVGLCVERSLELVVGLLGILKAGGAYVPLDPAYPADRLAYMLDDAAPRILLTQEKLRERLPQTNAAVIALDAQWNAMAHRSANSPTRSAGSSSSQIAYVIYTSGSTGRPKGVMIEHAGVINFLISMQRAPGICASDCMLAVTTISFDIAALEIFLPIVSGARVVLATRSATLDANALMKMLEEFAVTVMQATPATWKLLLGAQWGGRPKLQALCGGEAMTTALSENLLGRVKSLWNLYGPTETTIWSCSRQLVTTSVGCDAVESIGRPIANTQIYILDSQQQPVPIGVSGEIYIAGTGVARGYRNRARLTAERFVSDPFSAAAGARMYRTGDLGRWRADGNIEYLGRNDQQVKIRGFRIELGEIEAQLVRHAQVKEAVVLAREDVPGEKRLVAYVAADAAKLKVTGQSKRHLILQLQKDLQAKLPTYMIPSAWVMLKELPLTPNGKLDRRALPPPNARSGLMGGYVAPRTELERTLAEIWANVLGLDRVGVQDNFFELGGHSLLANSVLARISDALDLRLSPRAIFDKPTIAELGECLLEAISSELSMEVA